MGLPVKDQLVLGGKFGRWTITDIPVLRSDGWWFVECLCQCGTIKMVSSSILLYTSNPQRSCGCYLKELTAERRRPASKYKHPAFNCWRCMMDRCYKPSDKGYARYGGRGIQVIKRWHTFENFRDDMGLRPAGYTLERRDNSKGYSKSNCKWATVTEQARNRRSSVRITMGNRTLTTAGWSEVSGLRRSTIAGRIRKGWSPYDAVYKQSKQKGKVLCA